MDFLDPRKKRSHRIRLMIGYGLMAIAIGLGTVILVYGAYGYSIDTKTGGIVENGLLFVDSKPGSADIYLNGTSQNKTTAARLILPAGNYELTLKRSGYRDWSRKFALDEHSVARYVYPFLFPKTPEISAVKTYPSLPSLITQSPDRRWLLIQPPKATSQAVSFEEFDTTSPAAVPRAISLPPTLFSAASLSGNLSVIEWSADNNYLLLQNSFAGGVEFLIIDRRDGAKSVNLNQVFKINPSQLALRGRKIDQVYLYDQSSQALRVGNVAKGSLEPVFLSKVLAFKTHSGNLLTYITDQDEPAGQVAARIWDNGRTYPLTTLPVGSKYLIDAAQFQNHWYYVTASNSGERVSVYRDPLDQIKDPAIKRALPIATLRAGGATKVAFSTNTRFVGVQAGQRSAVYDFEGEKRYEYELPAAPAAPMEWMDGHRFIGAAAGSLTVVDYDSTNLQSLTPTALAAGGYFSRDFNQLFTLAASTDQSVVLQRVDMRAGADLPKAP